MPARPVPLLGYEVGIFCVQVGAPLPKVTWQNASVYHSGGESPGQAVLVWMCWLLLVILHSTSRGPREVTQWFGEDSTICPIPLACLWLSVEKKKKQAWLQGTSRQREAFYPSHKLHSEELLAYEGERHICNSGRDFSCWGTGRRTQEPCPRQRHHSEVPSLPF